MKKEHPVWPQHLFPKAPVSQYLYLYERTLYNQHDMSRCLSSRKLCSNLGAPSTVRRLFIAMCRIRFGLTGVYFDPLEPNRPREESFQSWNVTRPPFPQNEQEDAVIKSIGDGAITEKTPTAAPHPKNRQGITKTPLNSSLSTRNERNGVWATSAGSNHVCIEIERDRDPLSSSSSLISSSSFSSSSVSSPPSSDEDQVQKAVKGKRSLQGSSPPKLVNSQITQRNNSNQFKRHTSTPLREPTKPPPTKRVRFAMDIQERTTTSDNASDTSSSRSSDDSYTDPPSPTEPHDAFAGYYRAPGASKFQHLRGRTAIPGMQLPPDEETNTERLNGLLNPVLDSEDGSEVDVQNLPVKGRPLRTLRATGKGQSDSTLLSRSAVSGTVLEPSRLIPGGLQRNINTGLTLERSHASQKLLRYLKLRSGKNLSEPIFVVRPRFLSSIEESKKPADLSGGSRHGSGTSKSLNEDTRKTSLPRPAQFKAAKRSKKARYNLPAMGEETKRDGNFIETRDA
ncbi:hypothetical protein BDR22DRAFT_497810 [Usnea florida]